MSKMELTAIEQLSQNDTLNLKPADKGGALVVMDTTLYLEEVCRQLNDREVYEVITGDPKFHLGHTINKLVDEAHTAGIIDKHLKDFLIVEHPTTPVIYMLPKIHKNLNRPPGVP